MNQGQTEFGLNKKIPNNSRFAIGLVSFSVEILWLQKVCIFENKIVISHTLSTLTTLYFYFCVVSVVNVVSKIIYFESFSMLQYFE